MGEQTAISWCDHTFNPWWGCWKIAAECASCYASDHANRFSPGLWGRTEPRRFFGDEHWEQLQKWDKKAARDGVVRRVFVGSMCDWAEVHPDQDTNGAMNQARARLWVEISRCTNLTFLLLTKRPSDAADHVPWSDGEPWANVWLGTTAGTRKSLRENVPILRRIPAVVHFISCEPLLEEIPENEWSVALGDLDGERLHPIRWLIVGDESGRKRRPAELAWVRIARDVAIRNHVAFHFKQWHEDDRKKLHLPVLDGVTHAEFPA